MLPFQIQSLLQTAKVLTKSLEDHKDKLSLAAKDDQEVTLTDFFRAYAQQRMDN